MRWILILVIFLLLAFTTESNAYKFKRIDEGNGDFLHNKKSSPNGKYSIKFQKSDENFDYVILNANNKVNKFDFLSHSNKYYWSPNSRKVLFVNSDYYSGSGDINIIILDVITKKYIEIDIGEKLEEGDFAPYEILGARDYYKISHILWSKKSDVFYFNLEVNFRGESGHPGVNAQWKEELGDDFMKDSPVDLGTFAIFLNEKKKSKDSLKVKKAKCKVMLLGEVIDALPTVNPNQRLKILKELNSKKDNWIKKCIKNFDKELKKINKYNKKYTEKFLDCNMKNFDKGIKKRYEICGKLLNKE